jgi:hypothetical protein
MTNHECVFEIVCGTPSCAKCYVEGLMNDEIHDTKPKHPAFDYTWSKMYHRNMVTWRNPSDRLVVDK